MTNYGLERSVRNVARWTLTASTAIALTAPITAFAQVVPAPSNSAASTEGAAPRANDEPQFDIIVTGTREANRTKADSPGPIDVVGQAMIARTGQTNAFDALNAVLPSFAIPASGGDLSRLVRSARLRGLSPDQTLVLVDGKRRHSSASINTAAGPVAGSNPVDLDMITTSMIDHIEVLRDGAAAQYGSDAIAGVVNIITKKANNGGSGYAQSGSYYRGDGFSASSGINAGLGFGEGGYLNLSADYRYHGHSNRCGLDPRAAQFGITTNPCKTQGDPQYHVVTGGISAGYDLGGTTLYATGTYGYRSSEGYNGWRLPNRYASPWYRANYPQGFVPKQRIEEQDFGITGGIKGTFGGDWNWDLSTTYGGDHITLYNLNDLNASLITNTGYLITPVPTRTRAVVFSDREWTTNVDISHAFANSIFASPINLALGLEYRRNVYKIGAGEFASYTGSGATAYPGLSPANATNADRNNKAAYIELSTDITTGWQAALAGRFENYSDVGNNVVGKLTTRYDFSPAFGLRGTVSSGFRAPTLPQEFQTSLVVGPTSASGQLPVGSPAAIALGAKPLRAEKSESYSVGFVARPADRLTIAVDFYQIDIHDQIFNSGRIGAAFATNPALYNSTVAALRLSGFTIDPAVTQVFAQYYTNGLGTRTRGIDATADYRLSDFWNGRLDLSLAVNVNRVKLTRVDTFPGGAVQFGPDVLSEITDNAPRDKVILQALYSVDAWKLTLRETRWGRSAEVMADATLGPPFYYSNVITPKYTTDIQISYDLTRNLELSAGAINLFDVYPNQTVFETRNVSNASVYSVSSPFGFNGGSYYGRIAVKF